VTPTRPGTTRPTPTASDAGPPPLATRTFRRPRELLGALAPTCRSGLSHIWVAATRASGSGAARQRAINATQSILVYKLTAIRVRMPTSGTFQTDIQPRGRTGPSFHTPDHSVLRRRGQLEERPPVYKRIWRPQSLNAEGSGHPPAAAALAAFPDDFFNLSTTAPPIRRQPPCPVSRTRLASRACERKVLPGNGVIRPAN